MVILENRYSIKKPVLNTVYDDERKRCNFFILSTKSRFLNNGLEKEAFL